MNKVKIVFIGIMVGYLLILFSLFRIQFFSTNQAADNADYLQKRTIPAKRGVIYDSHGDLLAGSLVSFGISVDPKLFHPSSSQLSQIATMLSISEASISARLEKGSPRWAHIADDISPPKLLALRTLPLQGFYWEQHLKREYPEASLAASLIGFVGKKADGSPVGYYGLEGYYEDELRGLPGVYIGERDVAARPMLLGAQEQLDSQDGRDVYLTVDKSVQQIVKRKAVEGMSRFLPKQVCIIVANPQTMAILGLSCLPDYDPREFSKYPEQAYRTSAISDVYEPGSTFKPLIVSAALDALVIKPNEVLPEPTTLSIGEYTIANWDGKSRGSISISDVLAKSSNIGMVQIGQKLQPEGVYTAVLKYGLGSETGIDLQGEVASAIKPRQYWYPIDYSTATFGQGIAVTPLQLVTAFSSVINGGELLKPYVVERISDGAHTNYQQKRTVVRRVISESTSKIMRRMLEYTIDHAEYKWQKPAGYRFGGKTGTAQIAVAGKYDASKTIASFIGFTPVDNPKFIALVVVKEPSSSSWGSETAAPLFFELAKELVAYLGIPPEY